MSGSDLLYFLEEISYLVIELFIADDLNFFKTFSASNKVSPLYIPVLSIYMYFGGSIAVVFIRCEVRLTMLLTLSLPWVSGSGAFLDEIFRRWLKFLVLKIWKPWWNLIFFPWSFTWMRGVYNAIVDADRWAALDKGRRTRKIRPKLHGRRTLNVLNLHRRALSVVVGVITGQRVRIQGALIWASC